MRLLWLIIVVSTACILPDADAAKDDPPYNPACWKTNYQGNVSDLQGIEYKDSHGNIFTIPYFTSRKYPDVFNFTYTISHFGFNWTQSGISIKEISFINSVNLDYFRVVITLSNGKNITTQAIGPNDHSTTVCDANDVKRVDFYLAPIDFKSNVSLTDINLKACNGEDHCSIFNNSVEDLILANLPGIIRPGDTSGTFSASIAPDYPFMESNLSCYRKKNISFDYVLVYRPQNIEYMVVAVWSGAAKVQIVDQKGVKNDTFSISQDIYFGRDVVGDRIRSTLIPPKDPNKGISGFVSFILYYFTGSQV